MLSATRELHPVSLYHSTLLSLFGPPVTLTLPTHPEQTDYLHRTNIRFFPCSRNSLSTSIVLKLSRNTAGGIFWCDFFL